MCPEHGCRSSAYQALRLCPTSVWNRRHYYLVRYSNACGSKQKLGTAAVLDMSISCSVVSHTLDTWLRYFRPFRMQGFFEVDGPRVKIECRFRYSYAGKSAACIHRERKWQTQNFALPSNRVCNFGKAQAALVVLFVKCAMTATSCAIISAIRYISLAISLASDFYGACK